MEEIVIGFVEEDEYMREDIPKAQTIRAVSPASAVLGVDDDVLDNTVFTKIKMKNTDFLENPKKLPRLIFINKDKLLKNPGLAALLSPLVLVMSPRRNNGPLFTLCTDELNKKLTAIMRDSFLLLPLYASSMRGLKPWGMDISRHDMTYPAAGKLRLKAVGCDHLFLFGKRYELTGSRLSLVNFWKYHSLWKLQDFMEKRLFNYDIEKNIEPFTEYAC